MSDIIHFSTDGWYARCAEAFTCENVGRIAEAAGRYWHGSAPGGVVYVGFDARSGAREAAECAAAELAAVGLRVVMASEALPTAAVAHAMTRDLSAVGCFMVTGSSYPAGYLGVKLRDMRRGDDLRGFLDDIEQLIEPEYASASGPWSRADLLTAYRDEVASYFSSSDDAVDACTVVYDAMYGVGSACVPSMLSDMGARVLEVHGCGDKGAAAMCSNPAEPWIDECERAVAACDALAGFATDSDAERMGAVDEDGRYIDPDVVASLVLAYLVQVRGLHGRVVAGVASSNTLRRTAEMLGCRVVVKPVGYTYIYEELHRSDVLLATDGQGGICIPKHSRERDGILAVAALTDLMVRTGKGLKQLSRELVERVGESWYGQRDVRLRMEQVEMLNAMLPGVNPRAVAGRIPAAVSHMDGLRLAFDDGAWLLLRPSRVDPVVRVYAEASSIGERDLLLDAAAALARGAIE